MVVVVETKILVHRTFADHASISRTSGSCSFQAALKVCRGSIIDRRVKTFCIVETFDPINDITLLNIINRKISCKFIMNCATAVFLRSTQLQLEVKYKQFKRHARQARHSLS